MIHRATDNSLQYSYRAGLIKCFQKHTITINSPHSWCFRKRHFHNIEELDAFLRVNWMDKWGDQTPDKRACLAIHFMLSDRNLDLLSHVRLQANLELESIADKIVRKGEDIVGALGIYFNMLDDIGSDWKLAAEIDKTRTNSNRLLVLKRNVARKIISLCTRLALTGDRSLVLSQLSNYVFNRSQQHCSRDIAAALERALIDFLYYPADVGQPEIALADLNAFIRQSLTPENLLVCAINNVVRIYSYYASHGKTEEAINGLIDLLEFLSTLSSIIQNQTTRPINAFVEICSKLPPAEAAKHYSRLTVDPKIDSDYRLLASNKLMELGYNDEATRGFIRIFHPYITQVFSSLLPAARGLASLGHSERAADYLLVAWYACRDDSSEGAINLRYDIRTALTEWAPTITFPPNSKNDSCYYAC